MMSCYYHRNQPFLIAWLDGGCGEQGRLWSKKDDA